MNIQDISHITRPIFQKYNIKKAALFGSYARGDVSGHSDIDLLVELPDKIDYFDYLDIKQDLQEGLHKDVDLVQYRLIRPELQDEILENAVPIYQA
jgi:hypothetical protein